MKIKFDRHTDQCKKFSKQFFVKITICTVSGGNSEKNGPNS